MLCCRFTMALKFVGHTTSWTVTTALITTMDGSLPYTMGAITLKGNYMDGDFDGAGADPQHFNIGADYACRSAPSSMLCHAARSRSRRGAGSPTNPSGVAGGDVSLVAGYGSHLLIRRRGNPFE